MVTRPFRAFMSQFFAVVVIAASFSIAPIEAAALPGIVVSGKVINMTTGKPIPGVTIVTCTSVNPITDVNGHWQILIPTNTLYCARTGSGVPAGLTGHAASSNNPEVKGVASYEHQQAGINCYHNSVCTPDLQIWDRSIDGNVDFNFRNSFVKPVTAIRVATPTQSSAPIAVPLAPLDTSPISSPSISPQSSPSPSSPTSSFTSDDQFVVGQILTSSLPSGSVCVVTMSNGSSSIAGTTTIAGNYVLNCSSEAGAVVLPANSSIIWQVHLKSLIKNLHSPKAAVQSSNTSMTTTSFYDHKTQVLSFTTSSDATIFVVASVSNYTWVNVAAIAAVLLLILGFLLFFPMRVHRRRSYHDYLRSKYYNL
jgi:hypothetical protein